MKYQYLDFDQYPRRAHFQYFNQMAYPYVGVTVPVDITAFMAWVKQKNTPFFLSFCYCAANAANSVPEFRQRIVEGRIMEFERCKTSHTVALPDGTYCYCTLDSAMPYEQYLPYAVEAQERAKRDRSVHDDGQDVRELFFVSTLPWLAYTSLAQPTPSPADSNPRITWGKYGLEGGKTVMPVSVLCNHALVDGLHMAQFYQALRQQLDDLTGC